MRERQRSTILQVPAAILSTAGEIGIEEVNKAVPYLKSSIENLKHDAVEYTKEVYVKYKERPNNYKMLLNRAQTLQEKMVDLKKKAELATKTELVQANEKLEHNIESLHAVNITLSFVSDILRVIKKLEQFADLLNDKDYMGAMKLICELDNILLELTSSEQSYPEVLSKLKDVVNSKKTDLQEELTEIFCKAIHIENVGDKTTFSISSDLVHIQNVLQALFYADSAAYVLHNISKLLWDLFLVPIVDNKVQLETEENALSNTIIIKVTDEAKSPEYTEVFSNLEYLVKFLKANFTLLLNDQLSAIEYIGVDIRDNLSELLIKHCLDNTIPTTTADLQNFNTVIDATRNLEDLLEETKIFADDTNSIVEYVRQVDKLFIDKKCEKYDASACQIIKKDLYEMTEVDMIFNPDGFLSTDKNSSTCFVSKSTLDLLELLEKIMQQAVGASEVCASKLVLTAQNIIRLYIARVPEYHQKLLQTIPQQVALFHNNCYYLSYKLSDWTTE
ncbi:unnamed protein product [Acanthoscelides obtectus]|uniref:Uncharacterized protein n=1 Tax=Acanthoscelides obtectus TaxID=200917 RepID=A0A9P0LHM1_ACAOB|nr:unnamed protein product [Acanthoscelides obtectus]CAK1636171.1 Centromere/kinetochore protein zw10 homolog [Acanthoscelides obtectus]